MSSLSLIAEPSAISRSIVESDTPNDSPRELAHRHAVRDATLCGRHAATARRDNPEGALRGQRSCSRSAGEGWLRLGQAQDFRTPVVGAGGKLTPLRRLRFDPPWAAGGGVRGVG